MRLSIFHSTSRALREFFLVLVQGYERAPRVSQLPKDIQSPAIQDAISIMNQMGERQTEYIVKILKIYQASHQD